MALHRFLLVASVLVVPACDWPDKDVDLDLDGDGIVSAGEKAEDLEGEPCSNWGGHRICGPEQVQFCGWDAWGACQASDGCEAGEIIPDEEGAEFGCPVAAECIDFGEGTKWYYPECNTPLVLNFTPAPIEFIAAEATPNAKPFAAGSNTRCTTTDWPSAVTPWLVRDLDGDGKIDGGAELFGSATALKSGRQAKHGFQALADLDDNGDGAVDGADAAYGSLSLWRDHNADRRTDPGELVPLSAAGVTSLATNFRSSVECDDRGNCGRERASFDLVDSKAKQVSGEIVDVYLRCR